MMQSLGNKRTKVIVNLTIGLGANSQTSIKFLLNKKRISKNLCFILPGNFALVKYNSQKLSQYSPILNLSRFLGFNICSLDSLRCLQEFLYFCN